MSAGIKSAVQVGSRSTLGALPTFVLIGMILMITLRPVFAEDFWWHLARGRAVLEGTYRPSMQLLAFEQSADADWLSGLPWYIAYQFGGGNLISWLPSLMVALAGWCLARSAGSRLQRWQPVAVVSLGVAAIHQSVAPSPALFDLAGVLLLWHLSKGLGDAPRSMAALWIVQFLWSNFAPLSLLGPIIFCCETTPSVARSGKSESQSQSISWSRLGRRLVGLFIVGSLTPRGLFTFWDSLRTLLPWTMISLNELNRAGFQSTLKWPLSLEGYAFFVLLAVCMFHWYRQTAEQRTVREFVVVIVSSFIALSARSNIGPASLWLTLKSLSSSKNDFSEDGLMIQPIERVFRWLSVGLIAMSVVMAAGRIPGDPARIGWGIAPHLEPLLIEHVLKAHSIDGTAYCSGIAEAGMLAWIRPGSIRPADAPCRALLSRRLKAHLNLESELACGWRDQHRRSESGWGGWMLELFNRRTRLLLLSPQRTQVIRELETAIWKPLAIDTPCLPYALSGDPLLSPGIAHSQSLLRLVDHGEWSYPEPPAAGTGSHFDLYGWLTGRADPLISVRQAKTLSAMERYYAALRILNREVQRKNEAALHEFMQNQAALAYQEFVATGTPSEWRSLAYEHSGGRHRSSSLIPTESANRLDEDSKRLLPAVSAYVAGDWSLARDQLQSLGTPSALLALSQVELELGRPQVSKQILHELITKCPHSSVSIAGQYVLSKISD